MTVSLGVSNKNSYFTMACRAFQSAMVSYLKPYSLLTSWLRSYKSYGYFIIYLLIILFSSF